MRGPDLVVAGAEALRRVETHLANAQAKFGVRNREEIAAWAWEDGQVR